MKHSKYFGLCSFDLQNSARLPLVCTHRRGSRRVACPWPSQGAAVWDSPYKHLRFLLIAWEGLLLLVQLEADLLFYPFSSFGISFGKIQRGRRLVLNYSFKIRVLPVDMHCYFLELCPVDHWSCPTRIWENLKTTRVSQQMQDVVNWDDQRRLCIDLCHRFWARGDVLQWGTLPWACSLLTTNEPPGALGCCAKRLPWW